MHDHVVQLQDMTVVRSEVTFVEKGATATVMIISREMNAPSASKKTNPDSVIGEGDFRFFFSTIPHSLLGVLACSYSVRSFLPERQSRGVV